MNFDPNYIIFLHNKYHHRHHEKGVFFHVKMVFHEFNFFIIFPTVTRITNPITSTIIINLGSISTVQVHYLEG